MALSGSGRAKTKGIAHKSSFIQDSLALLLRQQGIKDPNTVLLRLTDVNLDTALNDVRRLLRALLSREESPGFIVDDLTDLTVDAPLK